MNEGDLKTALKKALRTVMPGAVVWSHTGVFTSGVPDLSCTWGTTSWVEVKYSRAGKRSRPTALQAEALKSLAAAGAPAYLLEYMDAALIGLTGAKARVTHLYQVSADGMATEAFMSVGGFDHEGVAQALRREHEMRGE